MASKSNHLFLFIPFSLFTLFSLFSSTTNAQLYLHPLDLNAFTTLHKDLRVNGELQTHTSHPCNIEGVFCERRLSNKESNVLRITRVVLTSKELNGVLSSAIGNLTELKELSLSNNQMIDFIPPQIVNCRKLEIIDLRNNHFSGEVPSELSSLVRLRVLDVSSNSLSGNLNFLKFFPNLETLNIADNLFTGRVPPCIRSFRNLRHFNFSGNLFLEGSVPSDTVPKRYKFAESSNVRLNRSAPGPKPRKISFNSAPSPAPSGAKTHHHKSTKKKLAECIVGFLAGAFTGTLSGLIFYLMFKVALALVKRGRKSSGGPSIYSPLIIKKKEDLAFLQKEDGVASFELIGRGGCGEVYKAELPGSNGKIIAIKKIVQPSKEAAELAEEDSRHLQKKMRQIRSEINTVGQIRHRNLLPLVAHVSRPDCHYLVYEYMKNGSLQDVLNRVKAGKGELNWLTRHKIAVGIAAGLEYLHLSHSPCIIHRDLKPANVLLDDGMEARIADFGLVKAMPDAQTHITASNVAGTVGYIAPEYHQMLKFTDKCDIYSFGVLLGVLVIGKLPSDAFFQHTDEMSLVHWMRNVMSSENPKEAIDPKLLGNGYEEQMLLVLKIACFCTFDNPKQRPNSKDVRCMLSQIKH
ncbi:PREDICTED: leucine-rich repeat receptor-like serine/threonine/tyrosine-protein kinase SOBIR1 [Lupinus angustifolius]|uniref:leucine-rich repeat receptor-like serine/threonine/tyrosine-protein kinase SOBIR1 n=1 Tax=Lupinus angustifolius TaxID=3871 RepID=UPI00092E771B|nr:PREDICTED: leucine-rich repeat receptor-like serine/threonine/tyrosine-protein kinase SOBIR1 [Lupinus angustifolius]